MKKREAKNARLLGFWGTTLAGLQGSAAACFGEERSRRARARGREGEKQAARV
jgi:hypothetical protein